MVGGQGSVDGLRFQATDHRPLATDHCPPVPQLFVPGRLCLFGEHSDWAGGLRCDDPEIVAGACIVCGTDQGIRARVEASADFELVTHVPHGTTRQVTIPMQARALRRAAEAADFFSYSAGVAAVVHERYGSGGVRLVVDDVDLPVQRGLSSSAAICVLVARAFSRVYSLGLSLRDEMELAYQGEISTGSRCGRMDQACAYGKVPVLLRFDGGDPEVQVLAVGGALHFVIVDLCARKDTRRILADLNRCFAGAPTPQRARLRQALGEENLEIVEAARAALADADAPRLGRLMQEAQALFDRAVAPACAAELTAPKLHRILGAAEVSELVWGGKGVGSQGDGAAQLVCRGAAERTELIRRLTSAYAVDCFELTIEPAHMG